MNLTSKQTSLLVLALTSLPCSRAIFSFFHDPEGPNLLIVVVLAAGIYVVSLATYKLSPATGGKKLLMAIVSQLIVVAGFYLAFSF